MKGIGKRIKDLRESKGWSTRDLGDKLDVSPSSVSNWETESNPPKNKHINAMCEIFDVSYNYLTTGIKDSLTPLVSEPSTEYRSGIDFKEAYIKLLEKHNQLLESLLSKQQNDKNNSTK